MNSNNKKQKFYCYTISEVILENDENRTPRYVRENEQPNVSFKTMQEAFESFLMNESYDSNIDTDIQFQTASNDGLEVVSLGFSKMLKDDGKRPNKEEIVKWQAGDIELFEHTYMIIIYEYECCPLTLKQLKRGLKNTKV